MHLGKIILIPLKNQLRSVELFLASAAVLKLSVVHAKDCKLSHLSSLGVSIRRIVRCSERSNSVDVCRMCRKEHEIGWPVIAGSRQRWNCDYLPDSSHILHYSPRSQFTVWFFFYCARDVSVIEGIEKKMRPEISMSLLNLMFNVSEFNVNESGWCRLKSNI